jgi:hypothetical protein
MARDFDNFPTYDPVIRDQVYLSSVWSNFMATFVESLREYLSSTGTFIPSLTVAQLNTINNPQEGQMVYVSNANTPASPRTAQLRIWQVVSGVGQWTVIV